WPSPSSPESVTHSSGGIVGPLLTTIADRCSPRSAIVFSVMEAGPPEGFFPRENRQGTIFDMRSRVESEKLLWENDPWSPPHAATNRTSPSSVEGHRRDSPRETWWRSFHGSSSRRLS